MLAAKIQRGWSRPNWLTRLLYPLAVLYGGGMRARQFAYRIGALRSYKPPAPLVVVGNLNAGGSGKTPAVIALAAALQSRGYKPGIIARGYGGGMCAAHQVTAADDYHAVGDEPVLLARGGWPVVVGSSRTEAAKLLCAQNNCDIIISDDGFQHLALRRTVDVVVLEAAGFGNGLCLPAGPLREPPSALARADFILAHNPPAAKTTAAHEFIMTTYINRAINLRDVAARELCEFTKQPVHAVAALGNPQRFFSQLRDAGLNIITHEFRDHHAFTAADFNFTNAPNAPIVMTEKDAVKCEPLITAAELSPANLWKIPLHTKLPSAFVAAVAARIDRCKISA